MGEIQLSNILGYSLCAVLDVLLSIRRRKNPVKPEEDSSMILKCQYVLKGSK